MLDIYLLRSHPEEVARNLAKKGFVFDVEQFKDLERQRKNLQIITQELQNKRNEISKSIGVAKASSASVDHLYIAVQQVSVELEQKKNQLNLVLIAIEDILMSLPNIPDDSVPVGIDESCNQEVRRWGEIPEFDFTVLSHDVIGEKIKLLDFGLAAKISGSRFVVIKGMLAKLQRALIQFMLDVHTVEHGYQEVYVPCIINANSLIGTGQLPKFENDLFKLVGDNNYYLTSTAEIPVTNMMRDTIVAELELPLKYVCHSPCFRSEAGSYGKDTKGMIRQHQFEKVELVWITTPATSCDALESLTTHAEIILQKLCLPYRVVNLCSGDMGANAAKTYDLEVWLPSQNTFREISSCSNMLAFQSRRLRARVRKQQDNTIEFVHTLNGSGLAVGRTLVAIMENYQNKHGNIIIPEVLRAYMGNRTFLL